MVACCCDFLPYGLRVRWQPGLCLPLSPASGQTLVFGACRTPILRRGELFGLSDCPGSRDPAGLQYVLSNCCSCLVAIPAPFIGRRNSPCCGRRENLAQIGCEAPYRSRAFPAFFLRCRRTVGPSAHAHPPDHRLYSRHERHRAADDAVAKPQDINMIKHVHVKVSPPGEDEKQAEAAKTARLRALRLIKEAADGEPATREIVALPPRIRKRQTNQPTVRAS